MRRRRKEEILIEEENEVTTRKIKQGWRVEGKGCVRDQARARRTGKNY